MTIKSEEQNHLPALDGALMGDHSPEDFFNNPESVGILLQGPPMRLWDNPALSHQSRFTRK